MNAANTALVMAATVATSVVVWGLFSLVSLFGLSRVRRTAKPYGTFGDPLEMVFVIPALNEERVIGETVAHLLELRRGRILVIDDGSDDNTASIVSSFTDTRVELLQRFAPNARMGKGEALNTAYRHIASTTGDDTVVIAVMDADGRLNPGTVEEVSSRFSEPAVGAVQISIRIRNRNSGFWTKMQHFEFVSFTALYQRGRERVGTVGLGGNGQFLRLSALQSLGASPWSRCLCEDLDLGIRLLLAGWKTTYVPTAWASQQGVESLPLLLRQRTRWFQGTLQCLRHLPSIVANQHLSLKAKMDLIGTLVAPAMMLAITPLVVAGWALMLISAGAGQLEAQSMLSTAIYMYAFAFLPSLFLATLYWLDEPDTTAPGAIVAGHMFVAYSYLWTLAGWMAVVRQLGGRRTWSKTQRVKESAALVGSPS